VRHSCTRAAHFDAVVVVMRASMRGVRHVRKDATPCRGYHFAKRGKAAS
jgi:hypothetical protein